MANGGLPHELSLAELCRRCRDEVGQYRRHEDHIEGYCLEIFHRAIAGRDEVCWAELHVIYHEQIVVWCRRAGADGHDDFDDVESGAWVKFWRHFTQAKLDDASGIAGVLAYLRTCVYSVVIDARRRQTGALPLEEAAGAADPSPGPEEAVAESAQSADLWLLISRHLGDERERVLLHLKYVLRLRPMEILRLRPDLFPSIDDVYRVTRNVLDRLRRSAELREWLDDHQG